jgi:hypothetical protein
VGEIPVEQFVRGDKLIRISEFFTRNPESTLSNAMENIHEEVSWTDLRFVKSHLEFLTTKEGSARRTD